MIELDEGDHSTVDEEELARDIREYATKSDEEIKAELAAAGIDAQKTISEITAMISYASTIWSPPTPAVTKKSPPPSRQR
ncbi:MAG TPA: hypothetical protein VHW00_24750 [Thermoanaerobaculia bacterium]|nr:hypothetical protein [Thermoanaerobaculia bacterium]